MRIKQVMLNYASNAIKYTENGQIDVFLSCEQAGDGVVNLIYKVKDTGYGIKEENLPKLFTMYNQFDEQRHHGKEGTGIGLAISKTFVDKMNGTVAVESVYGKGSTFSFSIPQKIISLKECEAEQQNAQENVQSFVMRDARILVTDDNEINRSVLQAILEPFQMTIDEAENGKEAVEKAKQNAYDLIFMDSHMPVMDGAKATKLIRELEVTTGRHTPIVATTADAITGVREQLLAAGMDDYLVKPIDIQKLGTIIQKYLPKDKILYQ
ncbi:MAG: response regulator [Agathobacter sp.]|nr:response regulator [Agathobacter sp.]